jgi:FkbM family methyltransferase
MINFQTIPVRLVAAYLRTFRWQTARWRLVRYALQRTRSLGKTMGCATVRTQYGFRMHLDLGDWVDQYIFATGNYEDYTAQVIDQLLQPGDWAIDIGANIGFFTLLMARRVATGGRVLAFEPSSVIRDKLRNNIALNAFHHIEIRPEAVCDVNGEAVFSCGVRHHSGMASLRRLDGNPTATVPTCRLESRVPSEQPIRLIKLDVEGAEYAALQGMQLILEKWRPDLVIEVSTHFLQEMGSSSKALVQNLLEKEYRMYRIDWDGLMPLVGWSAELPDQFNALFTTRMGLPGALTIKENPKKR